jgi:hypothetical protein
MSKSKFFVMKRYKINWLSFLGFIGIILSITFLILIDNQNIPIIHDNPKLIFAILFIISGALIWKGGDEVIKDQNQRII